MGYKLLAGAMSGVTMMLLTYPLDLARTRVSIERSGLSLVGCMTAARWY